MLAAVGPAVEELEYSGTDVSDETGIPLELATEPVVRTKDFDEAKARGPAELEIWELVDADDFEYFLR